MHNVKPRSNDLDFRIQHATFVGQSVAHCCMLLGLCVVKCTEHFAETFVPNYGNKGNVLLHNICRSNIFYPDQTSSTTYNMLGHVNKVIKRSRLFSLDKCCMLYCGKSSSFDGGLTHPTHCNPSPLPLLTKPTQLTLILIQSNHFIHLIHSPHSVHLVCSIHHTLSLHSFTHLTLYSIIQ